MRSGCKVAAWRKTTRCRTSGWRRTIGTFCRFRCDMDLLNTIIKIDFHLYDDGGISMFGPTNTVIRATSPCITVDANGWKIQGPDVRLSYPHEQVGRFEAFLCAP